MDTSQGNRLDLMKLSRKLQYLNLLSIKHMTVYIMAPSALHNFCLINAIMTMTMMMTVMLITPYEEFAGRQSSRELIVQICCNLKLSSRKTYFL